MCPRKLVQRRRRKEIALRAECPSLAKLPSWERAHIFLGAKDSIGDRKSVV